MDGAFRGMNESDSYTPSYYTIDELMAVCLARTINDGDTVFNGVAVALPFAAISLAKRSHAPEAVFFAGLQGAVNPFFDFLPPVSVDYVYTQCAEFSVPVEDVFNLVPKGQINRIFFGGGQIDRYGNANNTLIGSSSDIKVKLPGGAGAASLSCFANNFTLWTTKHRLTPQGRKKGQFTLVDRVDFITTVGHIFPEGKRQDLLRGGGPDWVVTDMAVFDFEPESKKMRLRSLHPGVTLEFLLENTGFEPLLSDDLCPTPPPTVGEVRILREIDPLNVRKRLFSKEILDQKLGF